MVIATATGKVKPDGLEEAKSHAAAATRNERGCLSCAIGFAVENPTRLFVYEEWETEEALNAHCEQEHTRAFLAAVAPLLDVPITTKKRTADTPEAL